MAPGRRRCVFAPAWPSIPARVDSRAPRQAPPRRTRHAAWSILGKARSRADLSDSLAAHRLAGTGPPRRRHPRGRSVARPAIGRCPWRTGGRSAPHGWRRRARARPAAPGRLVRRTWLRGGGRDSRSSARPRDRLHRRDSLSRAFDQSRPKKMRPHQTVTNAPKATKGSLQGRRTLRSRTSPGRWVLRPRPSTTDYETATVL